jgi:hypothetical protein
MLWLAAPQIIVAEVTMTQKVLDAFRLERLKTGFFTAIVLALGLAATEALAQDSITRELHRAVEQDTTGRAGILFGRLDSLHTTPRIWTEGAIDQANDLRLGCPTSKPALAFITLREKLDLNAAIDQWFPEEQGYTQAHKITIKNLLLNSSGIRDFVPLIPMDPDSAVTPVNSIDRAYRHQALLFAPGTRFDYSNTNFNIVGQILELHTQKTVPELFREYYAPLARTVRLDDGKGNYPRGYLSPWPYHWSSPGFAGGFIGSAADALRLFTYVTSQTEYSVMTHWYKPDGSSSSGTGDHLLGLGIFGSSNFAGQGLGAVYEGDMGPCQMILARVKGSSFCIYSSHNMGRSELSKLFQRLVTMSLESGKE